MLYIYSYIHRYINGDGWEVKVVKVGLKMLRFTLSLYAYIIYIYDYYICIRFCYYI